MVASSSIASLFLLSGQTTHSRFKLLLELLEESMCRITKNTHFRKLSADTDLIIWDEAPTNDRRCFEALDRILRDILTASHYLFGGQADEEDPELSLYIQKNNRDGVTLELTSDPLPNMAWIPSKKDLPDPDSTIDVGTKSRNKIRPRRTATIRRELSVYGFKKRPSSITAKELRRRAVNRFLDDDGVMCGKEVDDIITQLYAPDLRTRWGGVSLVQEVKIDKKDDRACLDQRINELVDLGMRMYNKDCLI
uniref:ATP-dependent DNA helicase n=1 Tax=Tanacetum cinerariifolium TaxID=118510 RepID=A0A699HWH5_TANCI|nr:DNA helicase [Tanacetum cinerariifolium]